MATWVTFQHAYSGEPVLINLDMATYVDSLQDGAGVAINGVPIKGSIQDIAKFLDVKTALPIS